MNFLKTSGLIQYASYFIIYLIIINLIGILIMYIDKRKAKYGKWRIQEKNLILIRFIRRLYWMHNRNVWI